MLHEILVLFWWIIILTFIARLIQGVYFYMSLKRGGTWDFIMWDVEIYYKAAKPYRNELLKLVFAIIFNVSVILVIFGIEPISRWIAFGNPWHAIPSIILALVFGFMTYFKILFLERYLRHRLRHYLR